VKLLNESAVYNALRELRQPATVSTLSQSLPNITEKTVRRALKELRTNGFVVESGKTEGGSYLYQCADALPSFGEGNEKRVPLGGKFVSVKDFIEVMASPEINPFAADLKTEILTDDIAEWLRRRMLFVIMSSGEAGLNSHLNKVREQMLKVQGELDRLANIVRAFNDSAVWFEQYRDGIAFDARRMQEGKPELFQLAWDYINSKGTE
jgi:hypothetical protein